MHKYVYLIVQQVLRKDPDPHLLNLVLVLPRPQVIVLRLQQELGQPKVNVRHLLIKMLNVLHQLQVKQKKNLHHKQVVDQHQQPGQIQAHRKAPDQLVQKLVLRKALDQLVQDLVLKRALDQLVQNLVLRRALDQLVQNLVLRRALDQLVQNLVLKRALDQLVQNLVLRRARDQLVQYLVLRKALDLQVLEVQHVYI